MDELILPQAYALYDYWEKNPPINEAMRMAWLKMPTSTTARGIPLGDSGEVGSFLGFPGVSSSWVGPPPLKAADVIELADKIKAKHGR